MDFPGRDKPFISYTAITYKSFKAKGLGQKEGLETAGEKRRKKGIKKTEKREKEEGKSGRKGRKQLSARLHESDKK